LPTHSHPCLGYVTKTITGPTLLNAIPPADCTERHLATLQRLAEIGMQLAERAAAEALQEQAAETPKHRRPDPTLLFIRLSAMVRACITQHNRLAAGKIPPAPRATAASPKPAADRTDIQRAVEPIINEYLEIDPDLRHPGGKAMIEAAQAFAISPAKVNTRGIGRP
jgi:hypothetical protein